MFSAPPLCAREPPPAHVFLRAWLSAQLVSRSAASRRSPLGISWAIPPSRWSAAASLLPSAAASPLPPRGNPRSKLPLRPTPPEETPSSPRIPRRREFHGRCARRFLFLFSRPTIFFQ